MSEIFGKIFGKDKHQSQQSKDKEKCTSPSADKTGTSLSAATSAKSADFCTYKLLLFQYLIAVLYSIFAIAKEWCFHVGLETVYYCTVYI